VVPGAARLGYRTSGGSLCDDRTLGGGARGQLARFVQATGYTTSTEKRGGIRIRKLGEDEPYLDPRFNWRTPGFDQTDAHPVVLITWNDAVAFCNWLTQQDKQGRRYRLPTEAEWEYACRAGTTTPYYSGKYLFSNHANFNGTAHQYFYFPKDQPGVYREQTTPVGSFPPNPWGLYDMHGNVEEWCQDWYGPYPDRHLKDPQGANEGEYRVSRGSSWGSRPERCRAASRSRGWNPDNCCIGFRVVLCLD
jgi:formylglycine-generating enzyme required for sulfatase activity